MADETFLREIAPEDEFEEVEHVEEEEEDEKEADDW